MPERAQSGGGGIAMKPNRNQAQNKLGDQHHAPAALPQGKTRYALRRWLGEPRGRPGRKEKSASTGIRSPNGPAHSKPLYRLSHPGRPICLLSTILGNNNKYFPKQHLEFGICKRETECFFCEVKARNRTHICLLATST